MKRLWLIFAFLIITANGFSQELFDDEYNTIFGGQITSFSGFGGPFMSFTMIDNEFAHMMGGGGGLILNRSFFFGGYGSGLTTNLEPDNPDLRHINVDFGHGGFWTGFFFSPDKAFHPALSIQTGWGEVEYKDVDFIEDSRDKIFVFNPVLELEMNITRFFKLAVGGNYRFVLGVRDKYGFNEQSFSGPGVFWSFKFGWF